MSAAVAAKVDEKKSRDAPAAAPASTGMGPLAAFGATAGLPLFLQTKLIVNAPGDAYEREADDVASVAASPTRRTPWTPPVRVSRISTTPAPAQHARHVQRKCSGCAGGDACSECAEDDEKVVQTKAQPGGPDYKRDAQWDLPPPGSDAFTEILPSHVRDHVEPVLGTDLGGVRVHTGPAAWQSTHALNARAFTHGEHIWLGEHESAHDVALMAHESAHVVQQTGAQPLPTRSSTAISSSRDGAPLASPLASRLSAAYERDVSNVRVHTGSELPRRYGKDAVAAGNRVDFAPGTYLPGTRAGDTLIAHEVAHVVQQRGGTGPPGAAPLRARSPAGLEGEAHHAAHAATRGGTLRALSPAPAGAPQGGILSRIGGGIADAASYVGGGVADAAGAAYDAGAYVVGGAVGLAEDAVDAAADFIADRFWDIVRAIYKPAEEYLRHPSKLWNLIIAGVTDGIGSMLGGLFSSFGEDGIFGSLGGLFKRITTAAGQLLAGVGSDSCGALAAALNKGVTALLEITDAVLGPIKAAFDAVWGVIQPVVKFVFNGIVDILSAIGGAVWDTVKTLVKWIGKIFGKVKAAIGAVWDFVKDLLGFGSEDSSEGGIWGWIKEKAGEVWDGIKETFLGWVEPLKTVGGILLALSPAGPLFIAFKYGPRIVHWIREIWKVVSDPKTFVALKEYVTETLLPGAMSFMLEVAEVFNGIASGIASVLQLVSKPLAALAEAFDATKILFAVAKAVRWFAGLVTDAVKWVADHIGPFFETIGQFFKDLWNWCKPILDVMLKIVSLANPVGIVMLIASRVWLIIPDCIKKPIIRFVLEFLIRVVDALPDLSVLGPLWPLCKYGFLGFLRRMRGESQEPDDASRALDRIARLVGGTADFALGLVVGILEGMWDGLIGPFQLVYMLIEGAIGIIDFFESLEQHFEEKVKSVIKSVRGAADSVVASFWPTVEGLLSGSGGGGGSAFETVTGVLSQVWDAVTGAAASVGAAIAGALITFIMLGDYELGDKLGYVAGLVLFEVILAILTAGVSAELKFFQTAIGKVLRLLVKVNEAIGEVFGAILKIIPGLEGAIARLIEKLGELPVLKNLVGQFRHMFGQIEELALAGLRRFGGEVAAEGTGVGARLLSSHADEGVRALASADQRVATTTAHADEALGTAATRGDEAAGSASAHADNAAAREADVADSIKHDSTALTQGQLDEELRHLADNPELVTGAPPARRAKLGKHEWTEKPNGSWCRASGTEVCVLSPPELSPTGGGRGGEPPGGEGGGGGGGSRPSGPRATRARQRVRGMLEDFERRGINPRETLNFTEDEWQAFRRAIDEDPIAALQDLEAKLDTHGVRAEDIGGPPTEPEPHGRIPDVPANPFDLPEYQEAAESARRAMTELPEAPGVKTTAGIEGGTQTLSGPRGNAAFPQSAEATDRALIEGHAAGRAPDPHPFEGTASAGNSGVINASHAEKQAAALAPGQPIGVSKVMCPDCQGWFAQRAIDRGEALVVADPEHVRIFMPDGSVHVQPHPPGMLGPRGNRPRRR